MLSATLTTARGTPVVPIVDTRKLDMENTGNFWGPAGLNWNSDLSDGKTKSALKYHGTPQRCDAALLRAGFLRAASPAQLLGDLQSQEERAHVPDLCTEFATWAWVPRHMLSEGGHTAQLSAPFPAACTGPCGGSSPSVSPFPFLPSSTGNYWESFLNREFKWHSSAFSLSSRSPQPGHKVPDCSCGIYPLALLYYFTLSTSLSL